MSKLEFFFYVEMIQRDTKRISERTKKALDIKKKQGFKLGNPENLTHAAKMKGCQVRKQKAQVANLNAYKQASDMRKDGKSYRYIANKLNEYGVLTSRGGKFYPMSVKNLLDLFT
ncbi:recombinase family protein [Candidatus Uabimicrobium sp. HlEnr_7]|uniref:recombinase family protein n=1 Tax=Candidatus Uabimicrobium helgolandensis TaxID=3095367 RepID=UPI00355803A5